MTPPSDLVIGPAQLADVPQVLALQTANLKTQLTAEVQAQEGFLTFAYPPDFMEALQTAEPMVVAKHRDQVVAYCLPCPVAVAQQNHLLRPLVQLADQLSYQGRPVISYRFCVMGQVCVGAGYRGQGLFDGLYAAMRAQLAGRYDLIISEVASRNTRSLRAHLRNGWQVIHHYEQDEAWEVVVWPV
ncbi:MAG: GNAT family N-acetyltransferase [Bernardetiaceae bacterium]|jgi:RimJ/RimL family protein N-acetyltransferase|nr:GNAT family N-acetyltransferase [Bernardetiaceae bacterium]